MYCTKCGTEAKDTDKFCCECGTTTGRAPQSDRQERLSRPMLEAKLGGVCAGFARYLNLDVTLIRILWLVMMVWPLPLFGLVLYIVAWIIMPKDPVVAVQPLRATNG